MAKDDDDAAGWGAQFDGREDAPSAGMNKELLRKALKLNPNLRDQSSTGDVLKTLEKASAQRNVSPAETPKKAAARDLVGGLTQFRERYHEEKKRIDREIADLERQRQQLAPTMLDRVLELVLEVDPNLTSITTQEMLRIEKAFLDDIQFSAKKVIEKKLKKR